MIDSHDGDDFWLASLFFEGPFGLLLLAVAVAIWIIAAQNSGECEKKTCPDLQAPKLMEHECLCVTKAK